MADERRNWRRLPRETRAYLECAIWTHAEDLGDDATPDDLSADAIAKMRGDVADFLASDNPEVQAALEFWFVELGAEQIGHDFWLTRNGHGAGFWDRFTNGDGARHGRILTDAAHSYGESYLYVADDGETIECA
jgi:hypothetical protein